MEEVSIIKVLPMDMFSMSIIVLFVGMFLNRKIRVLGDNYIPPAVTGGLLFAVATMLLYNFANIQVEFDMGMRDVLLLVFFSTVGLSARLRALAAGGKALLALVLMAGIFLLLQNSVGIGIALAAGALDQPVSDWMTPDPDRVRQRDPVETAIRLMRRRGYRNVPVVDEADQVIGCVRHKDIVDYVAEVYPERVLNLPPDPDQVALEREGG